MTSAEPSSRADRPRNEHERDAGDSSCNHKGFNLVVELLVSGIDSVAVRIRCASDRVHVVRHLVDGSGQLCCVACDLTRFENLLLPSIEFVDARPLATERYDFAASDHAVPSCERLSESPCSQILPPM